MSADGVILAVLAMPPTVFAAIAIVWCFGSLMTSTLTLTAALFTLDPAPPPRRPLH